MRRNLISAAVAAALGVAIPDSSRAAVAFSENFTPTGVTDCSALASPFTYFPAGWTRFNVDNLVPKSAVSYVTSAWVVREDFANSVAECAAFSTSWYLPAGAANDFMCTPSVHVPPGSNLSWRGLAYDGSYPDGYEVRVMTTAPSASAGNIGNLLSASTSVFSVAAESSTWTPHTVSLAAYANQDIYTCFRNNSSDRFLLVIDDVKVSSGTTDYAIAPVAPVLPYTRVPTFGGYSLTPSAKVSNVGDLAATNVMPRADVIHDASTVTSLPATTIASLAAGASVDATFSGSMPIDSAGNWSLRYQVTATQADEVPANNTADSQTVVAGVDELARDDGVTSATLGIGAGNGGELGQQFDLNGQTVITGIRYVLGDSTDMTWPGQQIVANLRAFDSGTGKPGAIIATTTAYTATATGATVDAQFAGGSVVVPAGRYVATVVEPVTSPTLPLALSSSIFQAGTTWVNWPTSPLGGWGNNEAFGAAFSKPYRVSLRLGPPPDALYRDGFEDPPPPVIARPDAAPQVRVESTPAVRRPVSRTRLAEPPQ